MQRKEPSGWTVYVLDMLHDVYNIVKSHHQKSRASIAQLEHARPNRAPFFEPFY